MAAKDVPPVIDLLEEEEEEWPEAGAPKSGGSRTVDKINNIFNHLSTLIHDDKKGHTGPDDQEFQEVSGKTVGDDGGCRHRHRPPYY